MIRARELKDNRAYLHLFVSFFNSFTFLLLLPMVNILCEVLCARPALDRSLLREQVNLADWAMNLQEKRQLEHIIDPDLLGEVRPDSFRKFGETTVKYLAESGVDRPGATKFGVCTSSPRACHSRKQYHPYWRAITANMQMHVKKQKSNNLNSKLKKLSIGKTTEKRTSQTNVYPPCHQNF
ncbi:hypothetical protein KY290_021213 [Solanum tuberosum]|uniref:Uncharacterized protein n=1 Tax=Solanum tuberosum TaxID=4113 RepID=A0ABQ7V3Z5_SOLTU|nr:hypothetical protein KY289_020385 [Solanum tuberosum]KAH0693042.1 hypothetical protein KY285_020139 [Solanum tuberosum]KAH0757720.1 hypothetical protein KY290_021213 [Solanum tuberosum]